jgi:serine phosphatase RsbU (regulator of sigma subunit)
MATEDNVARWGVVNPETYARIRTSLQKKRDTLAQWFRKAPPEAKSARLGVDGETAMEAHIEDMDRALEQADDGTLGVCQICHDYVEADLLAMDYTASICLTHFSDEELRRLEAELELSQTVQQAFLPQQVPAIQGVDLAAFSRPAQIVGGDYFDFVRFRDGAHGLVLGEVAGQGVAASLLMASLQTALRTFVSQYDSPAEVLDQLNHFFVHNVNFTTFTTLFLGRLEPDSGTLTYANGGNAPALLYRPLVGNGSAIRWLAPTGPAVGLLDHVRYEEQSVSLSPRDVLVLYTDGVTEAHNDQNEEFGEERLVAVAQQAVNLPAAEMVRALRQALQAFTGGLPAADDTTIIACRMSAVVVA